MSRQSGVSDDVLIVGAGPTGLTLANALSTYGVPFMIVDKKDGPSRESKALAINIASQYGFELLGLGAKLGRSGNRLHRANILWRGRKQSAIDLRRLDFHISGFIAQPQSETESELAEAIEERGERIAWRTQVIDVVQHSGCVEAVLQDHDGRQWTRRFSYVVGCDGKHSVVRKRMPVQFQVHDYGMYCVLGDFELAWDAPRDELYYYIWDDTFIIVIPIGTNLWRVVVKYDGALPDNPVVDSREIIELAESRLGGGFFKSNSHWLSRASFYMRTSNRLRHGRLFLTGDAAHLYSPIGGTGMNTGMQDALNLAWKIAHCLRGCGNDALLDTYETERLEAIGTGARAADQSTRLISRKDLDPGKLAPFLPSLKNRSALRHALPLMHSGLGFAYVRSFESRGGQPLQGSRRAGQLCMGLADLYQALDETTWRRGGPSLVLIGALPGELNESARSKLVALSNLQIEYQQFLRVIVFAEMRAAEQADMAYSGIRFLPKNREMLASIGAQSGSILLVRPDGIIGYSGSLSDARALKHELGRLFNAAPNRRRLLTLDDASVL